MCCPGRRSSRWSSPARSPTPTSPPPWSRSVQEVHMEGMCLNSWSHAETVKSIHSLCFSFVLLCLLTPLTHSLHIITSSQLFPSGSTCAHNARSSSFLPLQIIHHIVLILAAITPWRVCPFVCVRLRICVKVCADMFVSVGA